MTALSGFVTRPKAQVEKTEPDNEVSETGGVDNGTQDKGASRNSVKLRHQTQRDTTIE